MKYIVIFLLMAVGFAFLFLGHVSVAAYFAGMNMGIAVDELMHRRAA